MEPTQNTPLFQLNLDANNGYTLRGAASWGKVLGIVGIIAGVLLFVIGVLINNTINKAGGYGGYGYGGNTKLAGNIGMVAYMVMGLVMLISSIFTLNFGNKIGVALRTNDQNALNSGFAAARNYFAFWTIICIIFLLLLLITVFGLLASPGR